MKSAGKETKRADSPSHKKEKIKYNDTRLAATWAYYRIQSLVPPFLFPLGKPFSVEKKDRAIHKKQAQFSHAM